MKLRDAIKTKLHSFIQSDLQIQQGDRQGIHRLNEALDHYFHSFFDKENKSADDYYFKIIDVNTPSTHKEFILAFFSNNNIQKGSKLSLEVLCDEIVIHLPMKETIVEAIQEDKVRRQTRSVYEDFNQNSISLTLVDTQGLFHLASDEQMEQDRLRHMLYSTRYDALICLTRCMVIPTVPSSRFKCLRKWPNTRKMSLYFSSAIKWMSTQINFRKTIVRPQCS